MTNSLATCGAVCDCSLAAAVDPTVVTPCIGTPPPLPPSVLTSPWPATAGALPGDLPGTYPGNYVCVCDACMTSSGSGSGQRRLLAASGSGAGSDQGAEHPLLTRRRLLQNSTTVPTSLDLVAAALYNLQVQDATLSAAATAASAAQAAAATQLSSYAADNVVLNAINSGFATLTASHKALATQLNAALNVSSTQLAQAAAAAASLNTLSSLAANQSAALVAVEQAVQQQLASLTTAAATGVIQQDRLARLQLLASISKMQLTKQVALANLPCSVTPYSYSFNMTQSASLLPPSAVRSRLVGLSNRVVAGVMLYVQRLSVGPCNSRFGGLASACPLNGGTLDTRAFGVDPAFKFGSVLYNPSVAGDPSTYLASPYYNCSDPAIVPNQPPVPYLNASAAAACAASGTDPLCYVCQQLFNADGTPWGFRQMDVPGFSQGFPFFFDINLGAAESAALMQYAIDGDMLDPTRTKALTALLLTYNGELDYFCLSRVQFVFDRGYIQVSQATNSLRLDLYSGSQADNLLLAGEIILCLLILGAVAMEGLDCWETSREAGTIAAYFASVWNYIDVASLALFCVTTVIWWSTYFGKTAHFAPQQRYDVYANIDAPVNRLQLSNGGAGLIEVAQMYQDITAIAGDYQLYAALHGINIVLSLLRMLKMMNFQPRLGVITHTVFEAAQDLGHFFVIFLVFFFMLTMVAHLMFGFYVAWFADLAVAINTSFTSILGDFSWYPTLEAPPGIQGLLGTAYFWIWETVMILVLLNFLLAIICEAFNTAKSSATDSTSVAEEMRIMLVELWRQATDSGHVADSAVLAQLVQWSGEGGGAGTSAAVAGDGNASRPGTAHVDPTIAVGHGTYTTKQELLAITQSCVAEAVAAAPQGSRAAQAPTFDTSALTAKIFATCAKEVEDRSSANDAADEAELATNPQYRSLNEALNRLLSVHSSLLKGHREVVANQKMVEATERRIEALHLDLRRLRALQERNGTLRNAAAGTASGVMEAFDAPAPAPRPPAQPRAEGPRSPLRGANGGALPPGASPRGRGRAAS